MGVIAGDLVDVETFFAARHLLDLLGIDTRDCRAPGEFLDWRHRSGYLFNTTLSGIEQADACLIIGGHLRFDAPLVNLRLRRRFAGGNLPIGYVGPAFQPQRDLTYPVQHLGDDTLALTKMLEGSHPFSQKMRQAQRPMVLVAARALTQESFLHTVYQLCEALHVVRHDWNGFNLVHHAAGRVGGLDMGFVPEGGLHTQALLHKAQKGDLELLYVLGFDHPDLASIPDNVRVIYQGHHGDVGALRADVVLPGGAYTEQDGTYANLEGRIQRTKAAVAPPGLAWDNWKVIDGVARALGVFLPFDTLDALRERMSLENQHYRFLDEVHSHQWNVFGAPGELKPQPIVGGCDNFYMTNVIARHSPTMVRCAQAGGWF